MKVLTVLAAFLLMAAADPLPWQSYRSEQFGFSICYPPGFTLQRPISAAGDRIFAARDGAKIRVLPSFDWNFGDEGEIARSQRASFSKSGTRIIYQRGGQSWKVLSGNQGSNVVYWKLLSDQTRRVELQLSYPRSESNLYRPIVARMERCFRIDRTPG